MEPTPKSETDAWKSKVNEQKELLKTKEKEWRDADAALRRGISRLSFAIGGIDAKLDKLLANLLDAIRANDGADSVVQLINEIADFVKHLDDANNARDERIDSTGTLALRILRELELPLQQRKQARKLLQRYESESNDRDELDGALIDILRASIAATSSKDSTAPHVASGGFLERLITSFQSVRRVAPSASNAPPPSETALAKQVLNTVIAHVHVREEDAYTIRALTSRLEHAEQPTELETIMGEFAEIVNLAQRPHAPHSPDLSDAAPRIQDVLIQFVDELAIPQELLDESNRIKEELIRADGPNFNSAFKSIVNLVVSMRKTLVQEKQELEDFLRQLTMRLQEMDQHLGGTRSHQKTWADEGRKLEAAVHTQVAEIKTTVHEAADLQTLKTTIRQRLDVLQAHLDDYQQGEQLRQQRLASELDQAKSRLENVELEATQLRARLKDKHQQAIIDPLTGVFNRLAYEERINQEAARWKRYKNTVALLVFDADHFKRINDQYGHKAGDKALKLIAQVLKESLRETDFLARYGGEEFVAIVTDTPIDKLSGVSEKLRAAIQACNFHYGGNDVPITVSCGYAMFREDDSVETVFNRADGALYRAKELGRNQCCGADAPAAS